MAAPTSPKPGGPKVKRTGFSGPQGKNLLKWFNEHPGRASLLHKVVEKSREK